VDPEGRPVTRIALFAALVALACAGCGEKAEPTGSGGTPKAEPFTVILDYLPNADHAGIYAAQAAGLYAKAGLDVKIQPPPDPAAPLRLLRGGRADVAISYEPELLLARDAGAESLVSVAALVQAPLTSLMSLPPAGVHSAKDLAGKRVGTAGIGYQHAYLQTILRHAGVDPATVKETDVGFNLVPALVSGKVAATLGAYWNYEGVQLARQHRRPVILRMPQLGVPTYDELVVVARRESLDTAGASRLRRFLSATAAGYRMLRKDPSAGVNALAQASHGIDKGLQAASIQATLPVFFPKDPANPWGWQDITAWAAYERWMRANHLLKRPPSESPPLTNEFLAGAQAGAGQ
jgi:putative hydroxymethylpyrimidine transport system substrate-binding protein